MPYTERHSTAHTSTARDGESSNAPLEHRLSSSVSRSACVRKVHKTMSSSQLKSNKQRAETVVNSRKCEVKEKIKIPCRKRSDFWRSPKRTTTQRGCGGLPMLAQPGLTAQPHPLSRQPERVGRDHRRAGCGADEGTACMAGGRVVSWSGLHGWRM